MLPRDRGFVGVALVVAVLVGTVLLFLALENDDQETAPNDGAHDNSVDNGSSQNDGTRTEGDQTDHACDLSHDESVVISSYEWRASRWATPAARSELIADASAVCLDRVYVDLTAAATATGPERASLLSNITALSMLAAENDITIGAVAGDPWWPSPQGDLDSAQFLDFIDEANRAEPIIVAVHLDVEPWGLDEWHDEREVFVSSYLDFVTSTEANLHDKTAVPSVSFLVPYWFDGSNGEAPLVTYDGLSAYPYDHLASLLPDDSSVVVMAYRQKALGPGGILDLVDAELEKGIPQVIVAVETAPITPASATFAGLGLETLASELRTVVERTGVPEIVINDLEHLMTLTRSGVTSSNEHEGAAA